MEKLTDHFKCLSPWGHTLQPETVLSQISFTFTMRGFPGLYYKLREVVNEMDMFEFGIDTDNGLYMHDGDMIFNHFTGHQITDSGADVVNFIKQYLTERNLEHLIL